MEILGSIGEMKISATRKGFTLIELLVVIGIIGCSCCTVSSRYSILFEKLDEGLIAQIMFANWL